MKRKKTTFILLAVFFIGLSVLLYPSLSNYWNSKTQSEAIADYELMLENLPKEDYTKFFFEAEEYNKKLNELDYPLIDCNKLTNYNNLLNISDTGMMGYVKIGVIGVELPLYHGTNDAVLSVAIGHIEGTSLPVGGKSTHCVVSAHRGLPTARLFTDLDKLQLQDTFEVTILDRTMTYEVDQIRIVQPEDTDELKIISDEDHFTLLTCTPYGINTERLLVRGIRTENTGRRTIRVKADGYLVDTLIVTPIVALPMLLTMMLIVLFKPIQKEKMGDDE